MSRGYDQPTMDVNRGDGVSVMMDGLRQTKRVDPEHLADAVDKADRYFAEQSARLGPVTEADKSWAAAANEGLVIKFPAPPGVKPEDWNGGEILSCPPINLHTIGAAPEPVEDHNPKRGEGRKKPCMQYIPPVAMIEEARVMQMGAEKYGPFNWQDKPIDASTYYDAIMRHLLQWFTGEDIDPDSPRQTLHLAAIRASCGILLDAQAAGTLIDDRPRKAAKVSPAIAKHVALTA